MIKDVDYIIGFDFGHGETSVSMVDVGGLDCKAANIETKDLYIIGNGKEPKIPSMIGYDADGNKLLNFDAYQFRFLQVGAYFKAPMCASKNFPAITSDNKKYFKDFVTTVFKCLLEHQKNQFLKNKRVLYFVACPSGWNKKQQETYLEFFQEYCGLPINGVIEESRAAYVVARHRLYDMDPELSKPGSKIAVLDLGSSTLDITMRSDKAYTNGFEIGASRIEGMLLSYFLKTDDTFKVKYERYEVLEPTCKSQILYLLREAKERYFNKISCGINNEIVLRCQVDWEELSADEIEGTSNLKLKGAYFERLLDSQDNNSVEYKNKLRNDISSFVETYGKVDAVVLTGGASQMSFYNELVLDCYGLTERECVKDQDSSYSISRGTAIMGYLDLVNEQEGDPSKLQILIESIPDLIKTEIIKSTRLYANTLISMVDEWKTQDGVKTIKDIHEKLMHKLDYWQSHYEEVNKVINQCIEKEVSEAVNKSLEQIIMLYFGFNAPIGKIQFNCEYDVAITEDLNQMLKSNLYRIYKKVVKENGLFSFFSEPESMVKDRSNDTKLLDKLAKQVTEYIDLWFQGFTIDDEFDDIIKVCQQKVRDFYKESVKYITCQI